MTNESNVVETSVVKKPKKMRLWLVFVLLVYVLAVGAFLRFTGISWDEDQHLHPDERFLTMVSTAVEPVQSFGEYFDTANSSLNPHNRGYTFYVYGTLPLFIVRYVGQWVGMTGYGDIHLVGRALSATVDLLTVFLVFLTGARLYNRRVGVLAAAFAAVMVVPIQQSHFYTVDTFASFFMMLTIYFAVVIATSKPVKRAAESGELDVDSDQPISAVEGRDQAVTDSSTFDVSTSTPQASRSKRFYAHPMFWLSILFGLVLGMAVASKINAAPIAIVLPLAAGLYLLKLSPMEQRRQAPQVFAYLVLAGVISLFSFRIFQPYAFSGPGFFGVSLNSAWIENMRSVRAQTGGDVDFPPALQWARRPLSFSWQNMVLWGLGLPLGILAWMGFLFMAWRMIKGEWQKHLLLWGWTAAYFAWQSIQWNSTLRYQLPIYPLLGIIAAWFVITLYDRGQKAEHSGTPSPVSWRILKWLAIGIGAFVLITATIWAYAFSGIYPKDHTRVEASRWLFQKMPGPITLVIEQGDDTYNQPLVFHENLGISQEQRYDLTFDALASGELSRIYFPHVVDQKAVPGPTTISVDITYSPGMDDNPLASGELGTDLEGGLTENVFSIPLDETISVFPSEMYFVNLSVSLGDSEIEICTPLFLQFQSEGEPEERPLNLPLDCLSRYDLPVSLPYTPQNEGDLKAISVDFTEYREPYEAEEQTLQVDFLTDPTLEPVATGMIVSDFAPDPNGDARGQSFWVELDQSVSIEEGTRYFLRFTLVDSPGNLTFHGAAPANESSWDDGLPLRIDGYDPYGGIYEGGLNFEMYWDDNEDKYERFVSTLDKADYILISSSRQWGTTTRVPERYPLTTEYYRNLIGCPLDKEIEWCYNVAEEDTFQGNLGFDLVKIFVSNPSAGPFVINDQPAEEAFTVYDHPKVFIFKKANDYDPERVREILGAIDLSKVIHITPKQADDHPGNLMLPPNRLVDQRSGGTWSELFDYESLQNKYPLLTVVIWYLALTLLGWLVYPFVRFTMPGLADRGYPLIRMVGLLLLAYLVWMAGSVQIPFSRLTIGFSLILIALLSIVLTYRQKDELKEEWREKRKFFLMVELLTLGFFIFGLLVRFGNPDLWHPWKGGEKPMDFSYFNAVIKSTSFPPYDPWFAGGYINYYYYGFMIVGVLVKFLGIVPSIAYNLILPSLFSMIAMGAFSVGWNLLSKSESGMRNDEKNREVINEQGVTVSPEQSDATAMAESNLQLPITNRPSPNFIPRLPLYTGLFAAFLMAVLGNLGTLRMIIDGFKINGAPVGDIEGASFFSRVLWTVKGAFETITGMALPYRMDEWYWNPSRVIGAEHGGPITEFPYFTFLYGDLHAHLIALPITLLAIAWALSVVLGRAWYCDGKRSIWRIGAGLFLGGLIVGALYPVNLSDIYTYLPLGVVALAYAIWFYGDAANRKPDSARRVIFLIAAVGIFALLALFLYKPYGDWYGQGYSEIQLWKGTRTPVMDYLTHWGAFIFIFLAWMFHETVDWMASTPASALRNLKPYRGLIIGLLAVIIIVILILGINLYPDGLPPDKLPLGIGVNVIWFVLPLAVWAGVLLLRPDTSDAKRFTFFMIGTGLVLTLMVEIIVVSGDIGRMNTVFKFYLHVWALFSISAAVAIMWMSQSIAQWKSGWRFVWQIGLFFFVGSMLLYPLTATLAKIKDRMAVDAPHTLDGMTYMQYATHADEGVDMDLSQDYNAIRWMQDNIEGSPVIVEAHLTEYRWGTRYTIYTGLPGVIGWNWHQRQQRTLLPESWVWDRVNAIGEFYETPDTGYAADFLERYDVSFIIVGQLERAKYSPEGIAKFEEINGSLWNEVFRDRDTIIYEVVKSAP